MPIQSVLATIHALQPPSIVPPSTPVSWMTSYSADQISAFPEMAKVKLSDFLQLHDAGDGGSATACEPLS